MHIQFLVSPHQRSPIPKGGTTKKIVHQGVVGEVRDITWASAETIFPRVGVSGGFACDQNSSPLALEGTSFPIAVCPVCVLRLCLGDSLSLCLVSVHAMIDFFGCPLKKPETQSTLPPTFRHGQIR